MYFLHIYKHIRESFHSNDDAPVQFVRTFFSFIIALYSILQCFHSLVSFLEIKNNNNNYNEK